MLRGKRANYQNQLKLLKIIMDKPVIWPFWLQHPTSEGCFHILSGKSFWKTAYGFDILWRKLSLMFSFIVSFLPLSIHLITFPPHIFSPIYSGHYFSNLQPLLILLTVTPISCCPFVSFLLYYFKHYVSYWSARFSLFTASLLQCFPFSSLSTSPFWCDESILYLSLC